MLIPKNKTATKEMIKKPAFHTNDNITNNFTYIVRPISLITPMISQKIFPPWEELGRL